jgi:hypothetical protein
VTSSAAAEPSSFESHLPPAEDLCGNYCYYSTYAHWKDDKPSYALFVPFVITDSRFGISSLSPRGFVCLPVHFLWSILGHANAFAGARAREFMCVKPDQGDGSLAFYLPSRSFPRSDFCIGAIKRRKIQPNHPWSPFQQLSLSTFIAL